MRSGTKFVYFQTSLMLSSYMNWINVTLMPLNIQYILCTIPAIKDNNNIHLKFSTSIFIQFISVQAFCNRFNCITSAQNTFNIFVEFNRDISLHSKQFISVASNEKTIENACHVLHLLNTHRRTKQSGDKRYTSCFAVKCKYKI